MAERSARPVAEILDQAGADALLPLILLIRHHHEWFNGTGYPAGLANGDIPQGAAIIAVADAFDTMVTDRPYRRQKSESAAVADQVAATIHVAQLHDIAKRAAATDGLTGLANHRAFYNALDEIVAIGDPFALVLFDVEGLNQINDTFGHLAGDAMLREVAAALCDGVRTCDVIARYGGDEVGLIMRGVVRRDLFDHCQRGGPVRTTVRFGVASPPTAGLRPVDLVAAADARLYEIRALAGRELATAHPTVD